VSHRSDCPRATSTEELADLVERGLVSRSAVAREHGKRAAAAVRRLLADREAARSADRRDAPVVNECCEHCGQPIDSCECVLVCECGVSLSETEIADGVTACETCRSRETVYDEMVALADRAEAAAIGAGWECEGWDRGRRGSWYAAFTCGEQSLKLRVADHGSCYCTEDVSLVVPSGNASGDDHTWDCWIARLTA